MKLTPRMQIIVTAIGVVVMLAVFFFLFIHSRQGELAATRDAVSAEQAKTSQLQTELARLQSIKDNVPKLRTALAKLREAVPGVIVAIQSAADSAGIKYVATTPSPPVSPPEGGELAQISTVIGADGSYFALQDFVSRLYKLDRALRIDTLTMSSQTDTSSTGTTAAAGPVTVHLDITARIFFTPPEGAAVAPTAVAPAPVG